MYNIIRSHPGCNRTGEPPVIVSILILLLKDVHVDLKRFYAVQDYGWNLGINMFDFHSSKVWWYKHLLVAENRQFSKLAVFSPDMIFNGQNWVLRPKLCISSKFELKRTNFQIDMEVLKKNQFSENFRSTIHLDINSTIDLSINADFIP